MILSVHAIFGAAVASLVPTHPVAGFALGFASHLVLDAIPHKDYDLLSLQSESEKRPKVVNFIYSRINLLRDILSVSLDAMVGIFLAFLLFFDTTHPYIFLIGAIGSLIPDFLTFLYFILHYKVLFIFYNIHSRLFHSPIIFKLKQSTGVFLQFCTVAILILILFGIKSFF